MIRAFYTARPQVDKTGSAAAGAKSGGVGKTAEGRTVPIVNERGHIVAGVPLQRPHEAFQQLIRLSNVSCLYTPCAQAARSPRARF